MSAQQPRTRIDSDLENKALQPGEDKGLPPRPRPAAVLDVIIANPWFYAAQDRELVPGEQEALPAGVANSLIVAGYARLA